MACTIVLQLIRADLVKKIMPLSPPHPHSSHSSLLGSGGWGGWQVKVQVTDRNGSVCVHKQTALPGKLWKCSRQRCEMCKSLSSCPAGRLFLLHTAAFVCSSEALTEAVHGNFSQETLSQNQKFEFCGWKYFIEIR